MSDQIREEVAASRRAHGLDPVVTDRAAARKIAALIILMERGRG